MPHTALSVVGEEGHPGGGRHLPGTPASAWVASLSGYKQNIEKTAAMRSLARGLLCRKKRLVASIWRSAFEGECGRHSLRTLSKRAV